MTFVSGELVRAARIKAGLSQAEVGRRAGVTQPVISAYENGTREPSLSMLTKLVEATGHRLVIDILPPATLPETPMGERLRRHRSAILEHAVRRGASNVRVFGSVARGDDTESSDVDLLVDLEPSVGVVGLAGLRRELTELLDVDVDVVPSGSLKPQLRTEIEREAIAL